MRSLIVEFIPARFHQSLDAAYRFLRTLFNDLEAAEDNTNMRVFSDRMIGFFGKLYGPEKGWIGDNGSKPIVGYFRKSDFFEGV